MIELKNLTKSFGEITALNDLYLHVPEGVVYGLVGPNGCGKTTALNHACGAYRPDKGVALIKQLPIFENVELKEKIAYIPTDFYYYGGSRIHDMHLLYKSLYPKFDDQRFNELSRVFEISEARSISSLSKGMKQQVAFWLALSTRPEVLLLDEPSDGLDPAIRHKVWSIVLDEVAQNGLTVLTSSHNLRELTDVCDYVGIMEKGRMRLERSLSELQDNFCKVQLAFPEDTAEATLADLKTKLNVLSYTNEGKLHTFVLRENPEKAQELINALKPTFSNMLPLSLEEIFIFEMKGGDYEIFSA